MHIFAESSLGANPKYSGFPLVSRIGEEDFSSAKLNSHVFIAFMEFKHLEPGSMLCFGSLASQKVSVEPRL